MSSPGYYILVSKNSDGGQRDRSARKKLPITLGDMIGHGGEGDVYAVAGRKDLAAKIYRDREYFPKVRGKIDALRDMLRYDRKDRNSPRQWICTPVSTIFDEKNVPVGYTMWRAGGETLLDILTPESLKSDLRWTRFELCRLAMAVADRFDTLHEAGVLMADVNFKNIMASIDVRDLTDKGCRVWLIDVDSYQVGGVGDVRRRYACPVGRMEFVPEHLLDANFGSGKVFRTLDDELYALATLMFAIFIPGTLPWARQDEGNVESLSRERLFTFPDGYRDNGKVHVGLEMLWHQLPESMRKTFCLAFQSRQYPTTEQWRKLIRQYQRMMVNGQKKSEIYPPNVIQTVRRVRSLNPEPFLCEEKAEGRGWNYLDTWRGDTEYHNPIAVEIGANGLKLKTAQVSFRGAAPSVMRIPVFSFRMPLFSLVERGGYISPERLRKALGEGRAVDMFDMLRQFRAQRPCYTDLHAYGLSFLRNLSNRREVMETLRDFTGYEFKAYTAEEEAALHIRALGDGSGHPRLLMHLSSSSLVMALDIPGRSLVVEELVSMGKELVLNWFLDSHLPQADLSTSLREHDSAIVTHLRPVVDSIAGMVSDCASDKPLRVVMLGYGLANPGFRREGRIDISAALREYQSSVKTNRNSVGDLEGEISDARGANIRHSTLMRLSLPAVEYVGRAFPDALFELYNPDANLTTSIIQEYYK